MSTKQAEQRSIYIEAWQIILSYGAARGTSAETAATVKVLDRMGSFARSQRDVLRAAGWFD